MTDHFESAVSAWNRSQDGRKDFAYHASLVDGSETLRMAEACKCSVDTVENHRNAYKTFHALYTHFETAEIQDLWRDLNISHWIAVSKYHLSPEKALEHLQFARDGRLSERNFRAHVDSVENNVPKWVRIITRITNGAKNFLEGQYMSELDPEQQELVREAVDEFAAKLETLLKEG